MPDSPAIRWSRDADGIVTLTLDAPGRSATIMDLAFRRSLTAVADRLEDEREAVRGVIVTSAKRTFLAGGDLDELLERSPGGAAWAFDMVSGVTRDLRRIETLGRPVVAAINGSALGGGLELALACHHRVALDARGAVIGLPEVGFGLMPGGGGVVRTVRMLGVEAALRDVLLDGPRHTPARAAEVGLVDEVVATESRLLARALAFIDANPGARQPWDGRGHRIPGGTPADPAFAAALPAYVATLVKRTGGAPDPARRAILAAAIEGSQVGFETAQTIESRYFADLVTGQIARNMIRAYFLDLRAVDSGAGRPAGVPEHRVGAVGVLGSGGTAVDAAYACAKAGLKVLLVDPSRTAAEDAGARTRARVADEAHANLRAAALARIIATDDPRDLSCCGAVVEAVDADLDARRAALRRAGEYAPPDAPRCAAVAEGRDELPGDDVAGLHVLAPGEPAPLVELVRGEKTSDETVARAFDLARRLGMTPVIVDDTPGWFVRRVVGAVLDEAAALADEGVAPVSVERAAVQAGFAAPLLGRLRAALAAAADADAGGAGKPDVPFADVRDRLLFAGALAAARLDAAGVPASAADANVASLKGAGFPAWTGGALRLAVDGHEGGPAAFAARAGDLRARYGARFALQP